MGIRLGHALKPLARKTVTLALHSFEIVFDFTRAYPVQMRVCPWQGQRDHLSLRPEGERA